MSTNYEKLPLFLVLDVSASMGEEGRFEAAFKFIPDLLTAFEDAATVADKVKVSVITFGEDAKVVFPLNDSDELRKWEKKKVDDPIEPVDSYTRYSTAFKMLKEEIVSAVAQIRGDQPDGKTYKCYRPAVFFITDGNPYNDSLADIDKYFNELTDDNFAYRPLMVCVGVGEATEEVLKKYAAGKYAKGGRIPDNYVKGNPDLVLVQRDGTTSSSHLNRIVAKLVQSVVDGLKDNVAVNEEEGNSSVKDFVIDLDNDDDSLIDDEV